jgi:putative acetyltransferase
VSGPALRPYLAEDAALLAQIFRASIEELAAEDYDSAQLDAWISTADDEAAFAARLAGALTLVATIEGEVAGFASLAGADKIDMLYVSPEHARLGVASLLMDALEKLATARGAKLLTTDASDTARDFFAGRGYVPTSRNTIILGDEWIGNTTMTKSLVPSPPVSDRPQ